MNKPLNRLTKDDQTPSLYGLVLAGGKSVRMGRDKGLIDWHGKPQRYYLADLLANICSQTYISCRTDQVSAINKAGYSALPDSVDAKSQYGAILSAMSAHPSAAWLVVACDLPYVDAKALQSLIAMRDTSKLATAYYDPLSNLPEPLIAIWEPKSKELLIKKYAEGISCPRKFMILSGGDVKPVKPPLAKYITNVNTKIDAADARRIITGHVS